VKERIMVKINGESIEQTDFAILDSALTGSTDSSKSPLYSQYYYRSLAFEGSAIDMDKCQNVLQAIRHYTSSISTPSSSSSSSFSSSSSSFSSSPSSSSSSTSSTSSTPLDLSFVFIGGYPEFIYELCKASYSLPSVLTSPTLSSSNL